MKIFELLEELLPYQDDKYLEEAMLRSFRIHKSRGLRPITKIGSLTLLSNYWPPEKWTFVFFMDGDRPIGFAKLWEGGRESNPLDDRFAITVIWFYPEYRRQGIGRAFYDFLMASGVRLKPDTKQTAGGAALWKNRQPARLGEASGLRPISPAELTQAIKQTLEEYIQSGDVTCAYDIGSGYCAEFSSDVLNHLGIDARLELEYGKQGGPYELGTDEFWESDFFIDLDRLREFGETVPTDIPPDELASLLGRATHVWIFLNGMHYDAMAPQGVKHILELPFFSAQIEGLRKEIHSRRVRRVR